MTAASALRSAAHILEYHLGHGSTLDANKRLQNGILGNIWFNDDGPEEFKVEKGDVDALKTYAFGPRIGQYRVGVLLPWHSVFLPKAILVIGTVY